jgi:hypothetical protein
LRKYLCKYLILALALVSVLDFHSCNNVDEEIPESKYSIIFDTTTIILRVNGSIQLKIKLIPYGTEVENATWYDTNKNPLNLVWSVTDEIVCLIDQKGVVSAKNVGCTEIQVNSPDGKLMATKTLFVILGKPVEQLESPLSGKIIYSKGVYLERNTVIQSFDLDERGILFYDQLGGALPHIIFVLRGEPNQSHTDYMTLKYFGHGTNMAIDEEDNDVYIWINSNGNKDSDGTYGSSQTFSRIKYDPGSSWENYGEENYYLENKFNIHPALDIKNDILAVTTSGGGDSRRYFYFFKLSEAKALPVTNVTLYPLKFGGEEDGTSEQTVEPTVSVKNLGCLTLLGSFELYPATNAGQTNYYPFQGFDIGDSSLYFYEGEGNNNDGMNLSIAYVTVFDMKGNVVKDRTRVEAISNLYDLDNFEITSTGYMEAEGIKIWDGSLYLGFASKSYDDKRRANILKYAMSIDSE